MSALQVPESTGWRVAAAWIVLLALGWSLVACAAGESGTSSNNAASAPSDEPVEAPATADGRSTPVTTERAETPAPATSPVPLTTDVANEPTTSPSLSATDRPTTTPDPEAPPVTVAGRGATLETWDSYPGYSVRDIDQETPRTAVSRVSAFETPRDRADHYGVRIRALLTPPADGEYTFALTADNEGMLFLSSDELAANKRLLVVDHADCCFNRTESVPIALQAGAQYYVEAIGKEHDAADSLSVAWIGPKVTPMQIIDSQYLVPIEATSGWDAFPPAGIGVSFESWERYPGSRLVDIRDGVAADDVVRIFTMEAPPDRGDYHGTRLRALLVPPADGDYTFGLAADDEGVLLLSTDDSPVNRRLIVSDRADCCGNVTFSEPIALAAGQEYYIEAVAKEDSGGDYLRVSWEGPEVAPRQVVSDRYLRSVEPIGGWTAA